MEKNIIRLSEEDLHKMISESVKRIIIENMEDEGFWDAIRGASKKVGNDISNKAQQVGNNMKNASQNFKNKMNTVGNNIKQGFNNQVQNVKNYANDVRQAGINASNRAEIENAIKVINDFTAKGFISRQAASMVIGSMNKYLQKI